MCGFGDMPERKSASVKSGLAAKSRSLLSAMDVEEEDPFVFDLTAEEPPFKKKRGRPRKTPEGPSSIGQNKVLTKIFAGTDVLPPPAITSKTENEKPPIPGWIPTTKPETKVTIKPEQDSKLQEPH